MKKIVVIVISTMAFSSSFSQNCGYPSSQPMQPHQTVSTCIANNTFPTSGFVGINTGTTTPGAPLHIVGRKYMRNSAELIRLQMFNSVGVVNNTTWKLGINYTPVSTTDQNNASFSALCFQAPGCTGVTAQFQSNGDFLTSGKIIAPEVFVTTNIPWADYVFKPGYQLRPLSEVNTFIGLNGHLPGMPSAAEVEKQGGFEMGRLNILLLEKVEELTLYTIQQEQKIATQNQLIISQENRINDLERRIQLLEANQNQTKKQ